jgi:hypothetical protein
MRRPQVKIVIARIAAVIFAEMLARRGLEIGSGTPRLNAACRPDAPAAPTDRSHPAFSTGPVRVSPSTRERYYALACASGW